MASTETKSTPTTREALEQTLDIAEKLIQEGKIEDGLSLVRQVNDVTEEALKNQALIGKVQTA
jgi:hypothetical protein